ncbi:protein of unknown function [Burkholderia multivorans]
MRNANDGQGRPEREPELPPIRFPFPDYPFQSAARSDKKTGGREATRFIGTCVLTRACPPFSARADAP